VIWTLFTGLWAEVGDLQLTGPRARQGYAAALAVVLAVILACLLTLQDVWWAGISAFMSSQATRPAPFRRVGLRIAGTLTGAVLALMLASSLAILPAGGDQTVSAWNGRRWSARAF
jgi:uncharacterized membrane protein YccC